MTRDIGASLGRLVTGSGATRSRARSASCRALRRGEAGHESFRSCSASSRSIALLNLLPLLPLDGGHIVFAIAEGVRGRAVRREIYERVSVIGIGLVLLLFVIGLSNDIGRLS